MDYIIKDGWIVNGKKEKPFRGDLVIKNGKIAEVGTHIEIPGDFPKENILNARWQQEVHYRGDCGQSAAFEPARTDHCGKWKLRAFGGSGRGEVWKRDCRISQQCDREFSSGKR